MRWLIDNMEYMPYNNFKGDYMVGLVKKTQKTPPEEIRLAKERRADFKERMEKL